ncbi:hypothetical protein [Rahnella sp. WP5]|uniref:hypothetical protein n=1 Tax=Rahnella sp. WP5 TaxID=1500266 RepID=UPI000563BE17|nr:hypothetical protein [Rahnella sp. WP5]
MKNLLKTVRDSIAAAMTGRTIEPMLDVERQNAVKTAVDDFLKLHPADYLKPAEPKVTTTSPVTKKRVIKSLGGGAGGFQEHVIDPELLARAREAARAFQATDPDRYAEIITDSKGA